MPYWLLKSEPSVFSIEHLNKLPNQMAAWDGVRNYQARNTLRDDMNLGDLAFFYHSSCPQPAVVGVVRIVSEAYPDPTATNPKSPYFDERCTKLNNPWVCRDVQLVAHYHKPVLLSDLRQHQAQLDDFILLRKGTRLSVIPVSPKQWATICTFAEDHTHGTVTK
ncbi:MAG: EVE domain-containing protein [Pseudomonadota bacterium]